MLFGDFYIYLYALYLIVIKFNVKMYNCLFENTDNFRKHILIMYVILTFLFTMSY